MQTNHHQPFSLLNCFADKMFDMYWFSSGTPTYLIEMMRTHTGRVDAVLETAHRIYVIETKLDGSAQSALRQINDNGFADAYRHAGKPVTKVGINFTVKGEANFAEWVVE